MNKTLTILVIMTSVLILFMFGSYMSTYDRQIRLQAMEKWVDCHIEYDKMSKDPGDYCSNLTSFTK